jgi:3-oxoacyl-[acyl-carrier protein] reductase
VNLGLEGKVAVVTAATRGLGFATAEALATEGAAVLICGRSTSGVREATERLTASTGRVVHGMTADIGQIDGLERLFDKARAEFGGIDLLVLNGGGPPPGGVVATAESAWVDAFNQVFLSVVRSIRLALPLMSGRPDAVVLTVVSTSVRRTLPNLVLSNAFRPAIEGFCKTAAAELGPMGIRVNCIAPGRIGTDRVAELDEAASRRSGLPLEEVRRATVGRIPLRRSGTPEEFGKVAAFLCSPCSSYVNGTTIFVDGGTSAAT